MLTWHELWDGLAKSGWLSDLGRDRAQDLKAEIEKSEDRDSRYLWTRLADLSFDVECTFESEEGVGPYVSIVEKYATSSRDLFHPSNLQDELDPLERTARIAFEHDGRSYRCEVPWHDDFFRDEVHDLVNEALADSGTEQRFVFLPSDESGDLLLALIRPEVLAKSVEMGLLPESDLDNLERSIEKGAEVAESELFGEPAD